MNFITLLLYPRLKPLWLYCLSLGLMALAPSSLSATSEEDLQFTLINNETEYSVSAKTPETIAGAVIIPASYNEKPVTKIDSRAFANCTAITMVIFPDTITSIGDFAFMDCSSLTAVYLNLSDIASLGEGAFKKCSKLISISLSRTSITTLKEFTFAECNALASVELPDTLTTIEGYAFYHNKGLASLDLSKTGITSIGSSAFYHCFALTSVLLPKTLNSIGDSAFYLCTALSSIDFSKTSLKSIGINSFYQCTALTSIVLPKTLTSIGMNAFRNCYYIATVTFLGSAPEMGAYVFYQTGLGLGNGRTFIITIYEGHEASYASWRELYTFNIVEGPPSDPVVLVLKTHYNPSNQAFSIISNGEDISIALHLQHLSSLGDAWATVNTSTYEKVIDGNSDTVTRTLTINPSTHPTEFYRLMSEDALNSN